MNYEQFKIYNQEQANEIIGKTGLFAVSVEQMWWKHETYKKGKLSLERVLEVDYLGKSYLIEVNERKIVFHSRQGLYFMEIVEEKENIMNDELRIFRTTDYSIFKFSELNRDINQLNLKKIKHSMETIGFIPNKRILVNEDMEIIDGQHRYIACKELGLPIEYEIIQECENVYTNLNTGGKPLSAYDYIKYYSTKGFNVYTTISKLYEQYKNECTITEVSYAISGYYGGTIRRFDKNNCIIALSEGTTPQLFDYNIADEALYCFVKIKSIPCFKKFYRIKDNRQLVICLCILKQAGVDLQKLYLKIEKNITWLLKNPITNVYELYRNLEATYYKNCKNENKLEDDFVTLHSKFKNKSRNVTRQMKLDN